MSKVNKGERWVSGLIKKGQKEEYDKEKMENRERKESAEPVREVREKVQ